jgi:hypothetical protein
MPEYHFFHPRHAEWSSITHDAIEFLYLWLGTILKVIELAMCIIRVKQPGSYDLHVKPRRDSRTKLRLNTDDRRRRNPVRGIW